MSPYFHLERIGACACAGHRYHLSPSDTQNAHLHKCGWHLRGTTTFSRFSPLLPEAPLDGTVQLLVKYHQNRVRPSTLLSASLDCLDPPLCFGEHLNASFHYLAILLFRLIFVFQSQLCLEKMAVWSVSRSISDKALLNGNFMLDKLCPSIVFLRIFW